MAKVFTPELREEVKARIVELVCRDGRNTPLQQTTEYNLSRVSSERSYAAHTGILSGKCSVFIEVTKLKSISSDIN